MVFFGGEKIKRETFLGAKNQKGDIAKNRRQKGDINTEQQHNGPRSSTPTLQSSMVAISNHVGHLDCNVS